MTAPPLHMSTTEATMVQQVRDRDEEIIRLNEQLKIYTNEMRLRIEQLQAENLKILTEMKLMQAQISSGSAGHGRSSGAALEQSAGVQDEIRKMIEEAEVDRRRAEEKIREQIKDLELEKERLAIALREQFNTLSSELQKKVDDVLKHGGAAATDLPRIEPSMVEKLQTENQKLKNQVESLERSKNSLFNEKQIYEQRIGELTARLDGRLKERDEAMQKLSESKREIEELHLRFISLTEERNRLEEENKTLLDKISRGQGVMDAVQRELEQKQMTLDKAIKEMSELLKTKDDEKESLAGEISRTESEIASLNKQVEDAKGSNARYENAIKSLEDSILEKDGIIATLQSTIGALKSAGEKAIKKIEELSAARTEKEEALRRKDELESLIVSKDNELAALTEAVDRNVEQLGELNRQLQSKENELQTKVGEKEGALAQLKSGMTDLQKERNTLLEEITRLRAKLESAGEEKGTLQEKINRLSTTSQVSEEEKSRLDERSKSLEGELANLKGTIASRDSEIAKLQEKIEALGRGGTAVQSKIDELERLLSRGVAEAKSKDGVIAKLKDDLKALDAEKSAAIQAELGQKQKRILELEELIRHARNDANRNEEQIEKLKTDLHSIETVKEEYSQQLKSVLERTGALERLVAEKDAELESMRIKMMDTESSRGTAVANLERELKDKERILASLENSLASVQRRGGEVEDKIGSLQAIISKISQEKESLQESIVQLTQSISEKDANSAALITKLNKARAEIEEVKAQTGELKDKVAAQEQVIEALKREVSETSDSRKGLAELHAKTILELEGRLETSEAELRTRSQGLKSAHERIKDLNLLIQEREEIIKALKADLGKTEKAKFQLGEKLEQELKQKESEIGRLRENSKMLEDMRLQTLMKIEAEAAAIETVVKDRDALKKTLAYMTQSVKKRDTQIEALIAEKESAISSKEGALSELESKAAELAEEKKNLEDKVTALEEARAFLDENFRKIKDDLQRVRSEKEQAEERIAEVETELDAVRIDRARIITQLDDANKLLEKSIRELKEKDRQISSLNAAISEKIAEIGRLQEQISRLRAANKELAEEAGAVETSSKESATRIKELELQLSSKIQEIGDLNGAVEEARAQQVQIQAESASSSARTKEAEAAAAVKDSIISELNMKVEQYAKEKDGYEKLIGQMEESNLLILVTEEGDTVLHIKQAFNKKLEELNEAQEKNAELGRKVQDLEAKIKQLEEEGKEMIFAEPADIEDIKKLQEDNAALKQQVSEVETQFNNAGEALREKELVINNLKETIRARVADQQEKMKALQENNIRLKEQVIQLMKELEAIKTKTSTRLKAVEEKPKAVEKPKTETRKVTSTSLVKKVSTAERRIQQRAPCFNASVTVYKQGAMSILKMGTNIGSDIRDISMSGAQLFLTKEVEESDKLVVEIFDMSFKEKLKVVAEVMWIKSAGGSHVAGVKFIKIDVQDQRLLRALVEYYSSPTVMARFRS